MNKALTSLMMSLQLVVLIWGYMTSYSPVMFICFVHDICHVAPLFDEFWRYNSLSFLPGRRGTTFLWSKGRESSFRSCSESCSTRRRKAHSTEGTPDPKISSNQLRPPSFYVLLDKKFFWHLFSHYDVSAVSKCNLKVIGTDVERCLSMVRLSCKTLKTFPVLAYVYLT